MLTRKDIEEGKYKLKSNVEAYGKLLKNILIKLKNYYYNIKWFLRFHIKEVQLIFIAWLLFTITTIVIFQINKPTHKTIPIEAKQKTSKNKKLDVYTNDTYFSIDLKPDTLDVYYLNIFLNEATNTLTIMVDRNDLIKLSDMIIKKTKETE